MTRTSSSGNGQQRSVEVCYEDSRGRRHSMRLQKAKMWLGMILTVLLILSILGSAGVWAGNQLWHKKSEAKEHEKEMVGKVGEIRDTLKSLKLEIGRLQGNVQDLSREVTDFISETNRQRLEDLIRETEQEIARYERQIELDGNEARPRDSEQLQKLKSQRNRYKRELERYYKYHLKGEVTP